MKKRSFRDAVVWITGASSGIGEALARELANAGAKLILSSNDGPELARAARECGAPREDVQVLPLDLEDFDALPDAAARAWAMFGRVDVLVNNAGITQRSLAADTTMAVYRKLMNVDCLGHIALTQAVLPRMTARGSGYILATLSVAGYVGTPFRTGYAAAKYGLRGYFDGLRHEVWGLGIRTSLIVPGFIGTGISSRALEGDGSRHGKTDPADEAGLPPGKAARKIVKAMEREKREIFVGGWELGIVLLKRLRPGLADLVLRRRGTDVI